MDRSVYQGTTPDVSYSINYGSSFKMVIIKHDKCIKSIFIYSIKNLILNDSLSDTPIDCGVDADWARYIINGNSRRSI